MHFSILPVTLEQIEAICLISLKCDKRSMWNRVSERSSFVCEKNLFSFYLSCTQTHVFALCSYLLGQTAHQEEAIIASMCWLPSPPHACAQSNQVSAARVWTWTEPSVLSTRVLFFFPTARWTFLAQTCLVSVHQMCEGLDESTRNKTQCSTMCHCSCCVNKPTQFWSVHVRCPDMPREPSRSCFAELSRRLG